MFNLKTQLEGHPEEPSRTSWLGLTTPFLVCLLVYVITSDAALTALWKHIFVNISISSTKSNVLWALDRT